MALNGKDGCCGHEACGSERRTCAECGETKQSCTCGKDGGCSCGGDGDCEGDSCKCHSSPQKRVAIAIDGPASAGKTSTAKALARKLGYVYVDTGAIYRAFAVHKLWLTKEVSEKEPENLPVTNETAIHTFDFEFGYDENGEIVTKLFGTDITGYLRTPEVSMESSNVAVDPAVREALLEVQRRQALIYNVVMEGRDIGTVVLPDADVKIFLTASLTARSNRRVKDLIASGESADYCSVMEQLRARDWQDSTRKAAPLREACDAEKIDNSDMTLDETVEAILKIIERKVG